MMITLDEFAGFVWGHVCSFPRILSDVLYKKA